MDHSISQDQKHIVFQLALHRHIVLVKRGQQFTKESRATETYLRKHLPVSLEDPLNTIYTGILRVSVEGEAVVDLLHTHMHGNATKTEGRELPRVVIRLQDLSYLLNCLLILVKLVQGV